MQPRSCQMQLQLFSLSDCLSIGTSSNCAQRGSQHILLMSLRQFYKELKEAHEGLGPFEAVDVVYRPDLLWGQI